MFDVLPRSLFNRGNGGIKLSYHHNGRVITHDMYLSSNDLAAKLLHSYVTLLKLLYAFSIHTRSCSPHGTDHVSQLFQEDNLSDQISQAVNIFDEMITCLD